MIVFLSAQECCCHIIDSILSWSIGSVGLASHQTGVSLSHMVAVGHVFMGELYFRVCACLSSTSNKPSVLYKHLLKFAGSSD